MKWLAMRIVAWYLNWTEPTNNTYWKAHRGVLYVMEISADRWWRARDMTEVKVKPWK